MKETIQTLSNQLNAAYAKACNSALPQDWGDATLIARRLVNKMAEENIIIDNFQEVYKKVIDRDK